MAITTTLLLAILLVGVVGQFYFLIGDRRESKRRLWPWWIGVVCVLFALTPVAGGAAWALLFTVPAVALTGLMMYTCYRFCDNCGALCQLVYRRQGHCRRCGAEVAR